MQLFSPSATACALYSTLSTARAAGVHNFAGWPSTLPFLFYGAGAAPTAVRSTALGRTMSFDSTLDTGTSDELWFVLAKFALNGSLVGVEVRLSISGGVRIRLHLVCAYACVFAAPDISVAVLWRQ